MLRDSSLQHAGELRSLNPALARSFKPGAAPVALGTLLETRSSSDPSPSSDGLREAVLEIFHALSNLLNEEPESAQAYLQRAASALRLAPRSSDLGCTAPKRAQQFRGGLAPWQARVLKTHIDTHLDVTIRTTELARLVQLSAFHFCRVFRVSFGHSPHSYVTRRRIERAQGLMLTTKFPLGQIAVDCGFSDQAHFNKLFRRFAGESPGEWRRMRSDASGRSQAPPEVPGRLAPTRDSRTRLDLREAAVHRQFGARDETAVVAGEKHHGFRDIIGGA